MPRLLDPDLPTRRVVLDAIIRHKREHDGCAPSLRELMAATGLATVSAVEHQLSMLEEMGYIERRAGQRYIAVVGGEWRMT